MVKVNYTSVHKFTVTDDDSFTVGVVNGVPPGASLSGYQGHYNFTWTSNHIENISLTLYATDSLNASSLLSVQVQQCACQNSGSCTLNGAATSDQNSVVMNCDCTQGTCMYMYMQCLYCVCNVCIVCAMFVLCV